MKLTEQQKAWLEVALQRIAIGQLMVAGTNEQASIIIGMGLDEIRDILGMKKE